eukprot:Phypoly_transcript_07374.p1 GENE.Phypoly_transcript_07374~~Phypoly_transcript_07374.p1  ORF type:complete len:495 (+),score=73.91 Phypoly_transcript_07374:131-1615(+)
MSSVQWGDESAVRNAIKDVRSDTTETNWALITYEGPKSQTLVLAGSGKGGLNELAEHLQPDQVGYGLVRRTDRIDESETVKFAFILFIGDKVGTMQKARISVHAGAVKDFIGQFHVDITATSTSELSDDILSRKIQDTSGSGTRVLDETGARVATKQGGPAKSASLPRSTSNSKDTLSFEDQDAIKQLRAGDVNWVLYTYSGGNSNTIVLKGKGTGGVDELVSHLDDTTVGYGLVRLIERIDESDTVKFAYINWTGDNIPRMLRARLGTHSGAVKEFLSPYHVDINATQKSEVTEDIVRSTVKKAAGTADHVIAKSSSGHSMGGSGEYRSSPGRASSHGLAKPAVAQQTQGINLVSESEINGALQDVRSDASPINWALVTYDGPNSTALTLLGKGSGGLQEMTSYLKDDIVAYGLLREVEQYELTQNVRFVFVDWVGENIHRMLRAKLGTHSGAVKALFSPYHVDLHPTTLSEITSDLVADKIQRAMGTAKHVL